MTYILVVITLIGTVAAQLTLKRGLLSVGEFHLSAKEIIPFFTRAISNPLIWVSVLLTLLASVTWILAVSRSQISLIYPLMGLTYIIVAVFGVIFLKEQVTILTWTGISFITLGVILIFVAKSQSGL